MLRAVLNFRRRRLLKAAFADLTEREREARRRHGRLREIHAERTARLHTILRGNV
jgi:hypothetical protein